jgi:hypothetical protein
MGGLEGLDRAEKGRSGAAPVHGIAARRDVAGGVLRGLRIFNKPRPYNAGIAAARGRGSKKRRQDALRSSGVNRRYRSLLRENFFEEGEGAGVVGLA